MASIKSTAGVRHNAFRLNAHKSNQKNYLIIKNNVKV